MPMLRVLATAFATALLLAPVPATAQVRCGVTGTYLTVKSHDASVDPSVVGRTLLSFLPGGQMVMIDAAQGGIKGFQPFTDARGEWTCEAAGAEGEPFRAVMVDFTFATDAKPDAMMARVDLIGHYSAGTVKGRATISFYPLSGNPLDAAAGADVIGYDFTGTRITADSR